MNPTPTPTLEAVQVDFQQWRQNKPRLRSRTPDELRQKALALLADHRSSQVQKALGITDGMLKAWAGKTTHRRGSEPQPIEFVVLRAEPEPACSATEPMKLDFTRPNGDHWSLQGNLNDSQLRAFVTALSGGAQ
jgi:hypothetical protein